MTKASSKTTKRALLGSIIALVLCFAMLIGTTFAWFTDSVSSTGNKIQSGTLDIGLEMKDAEGNWVNAEGETLGWVAADGRDQDQILWEPGCSYELPTLKITNKGNLALQFKILINSISGDKKLLDALEFTCTYAAYQEDWAAELEPVQGSDMVNLPYELPVYPIPQSTTAATVAKSSAIADSVLSEITFTVNTSDLRNILTIKPTWGNYSSSTTTAATGTSESIVQHEELIKNDSVIGVPTIQETTAIQNTQAPTSTETTVQTQTSTTVATTESTLPETTVTHDEHTNATIVQTTAENTTVIE